MSAANVELLGKKISGFILAVKTGYCFLNIVGHKGRVFAPTRLCSNWQHVSNGAKVTMVLEENPLNRAGASTYNATSWTLSELPATSEYKITGKIELGTICGFNGKFGRVHPIFQDPTAFIRPDYSVPLSTKSGTIRFEKFTRLTGRVYSSLNNDQLVVFIADRAQKGPVAHCWAPFEDYIGANPDTEIIVDEGCEGSRRELAWRGTLRELIDQHPLRENGMSNFQPEFEGQHFVFKARCQELSPEFYRIPNDHDPRVLAHKHTRREALLSTADADKTYTYPALAPAFSGGDSQEVGNLSTELKDRRYREVSLLDERQWSETPHVNSVAKNPDIPKVPKTWKERLKRLFK